MSLASLQQSLDPSATATMKHLSLALRSNMADQSLELTKRMDALTAQTEESIVTVYNKHLQLQTQLAVAEKHFSEKEALLTQTISDLKTQIAAQQRTIDTLKQESAEADERLKTALATHNQALQAVNQAHKSELGAVKNQAAIAQKTLQTKYDTVVRGVELLLQKCFKTEAEISKTMNSIQNQIVWDAHNDGCWKILRIREQLQIIWRDR